MNVELGAGLRTPDGWIGIDVAPCADIVGDALRLPFRDGCCDALRAVDVLEHISYRDTDAALAEWYRVLKPGGYLFVQVPSAGTIMRWYVEGNPRLRRWDQGVCTLLQGATWRQLGGHRDGHYDVATDWRMNAHYALFDEEHLRRSLMHAGFTVEAIEENRHPNLLCRAVK